jgi:hypothetical protein
LSQSLGYHLFDSLKKREFKTIPAAQIIGKVLNICRKNIHKHLLAHATAHIGFSRQPPYASKQTTSTAARINRLAATNLELNSGKNVEISAKTTGIVIVAESSQLLCSEGFLFSRLP